MCQYDKKSIHAKFTGYVRSVAVSRTVNQNIFYHGGGGGGINICPFCICVSEMTGTFLEQFVFSVVCFSEIRVRFLSTKEIILDAIIVQAQKG